MNLRFPGQYYDAETGLHYDWHRYYDPVTGRYVTPDPIGLAGGINPFVYAESNPVNFTDPNGLIPPQLAGVLLGGGIDLSAQLIRGGKINWVSVGTSAVAGATGVGLASAVSKLTTNVGLRLALNISGSSSLSAATQYSRNIIEDNPCPNEGVVESAILGGVLGGAGFVSGTLTETFISKNIWNYLSLNQKLFVSSNAISTVRNTVPISVGAGNAIGNTISNSGPMLSD